MLATDFMGGDYLRGSDFDAGESRQLRVIAVEAVEFGRGRDRERKLTLHFDGDDKALVLNKTNIQFLCDNIGEDTEQWKGWVVDVQAVPIMFQGERVLSLTIITVRAPETKTKAK
jgi:hypothetical protein